MALSIKRKENQGLRIGNVWVYVKLDPELKDQVQLSIVAPPNVSIMREELLIKEGKSPGPLFMPSAYKMFRDSSN